MCVCSHVEECVCSHKVGGRLITYLATLRLQWEGSSSLGQLVLKFLPLQASSSVPHPHTNPDLCNAKAGVSKPGAPSLPAAAMEHKLPGSVTDQLACMANHLLHEPAMSPLHEPLLVVSPEIYQLACSGRPHRCVQVHVEDIVPH